MGGGEINKRVSLWCQFLDSCTNKKGKEIDFSLLLILLERYLKEKKKKKKNFTKCPTTFKVKRCAQQYGKEKYCHRLLQHIHHGKNTGITWIWSVNSIFVPAAALFHEKMQMRKEFQVPQAESKLNSGGKKLGASSSFSSWEACERYKVSTGRRRPGVTTEGTLRGTRAALAGRWTEAAPRPQWLGRRQ